MMGTESSPAEKTTKGGWADPRISFFLMISTFVIGGVGVALGFYGLANGGGPKALHYSILLTVGVPGLLSLLRHSVFHASDAARTGYEGEPFFMIELGFATGAVGLLAIFAFAGSWGVAAEVVITLAYALYLALALCLFSVRMKAKGLDGGKIMSMSMWLLVLVFMFYFAIAAAIAAHLSPF